MTALFNPPGTKTRYVVCVPPPNLPESRKRDYPYHVYKIAGCVDYHGLPGSRSHVPGYQGATVYRICGPSSFHNAYGQVLVTDVWDENNPTIIQMISEIPLPPEWLDVPPEQWISHLLRWDLPASDTP